jgi:hypothetical protein
MINDASHVIIGTGKINVWQCLDLLKSETKIHQNLQGYEYHPSSAYRLGTERLQLSFDGINPYGAMTRP